MDAAIDRIALFDKGSLLTDAPKAAAARWLLRTAAFFYAGTNSKYLLTMAICSSSAGW